MRNISMRAIQILISGAFLAVSIPGFGQVPPGAGPGGLGSAEPKEDSHSKDSVSQSDLKHLAELVDQWNRIEGNSGVPPRVAKVRARQMLKVLHVTCDVKDAAFQGRTPAQAGTGNPDTYLYEAACSDGMGYALNVQGNTLTGTSCLVAGRDGSKVSCALPANADSKAMAATVLRNNSIQCAVKDIKWLGSDTANRDHVEVACDDGGYIVRSPRPGTVGKLDVLNCQEAGKQGIACEQTPVAAGAAHSTTDADARPPLSWFKDALAKNGVSCETKQARIVGRESIKRRYLVEFQCTERPQGLVAIVPAAGDTTNTFEALDCDAAALRGVRCQFKADGKPQTAQ
jgi:hypothetical protein